MQLPDLWCNPPFTVIPAREKVAPNNNWVWREALLITQQLLASVSVPPTSQVKSLFIAMTPVPVCR